MLKKNKQKLILVTGSHRSGTTWVGNILSKSSGSRYIHEPFNLDLKYKKSPLKFWYEYLSATASDNKKQKEVSKYLESLYGLQVHDVFNSCLELRSKKDFLSWVRDIKGKITHTTIMKDPIALFAAPWIYEKLNCEVVVCIRHPAAFVASLMAKGWTFDFNNFVAQPQLMEERLKGYEQSIRKYAKKPPGIVEQGILLWNCLYSVVLNYQREYMNEWNFIKHEVISNDPIQEFKKLYNSLGLNFTVEAEGKIVSSSQAKFNDSLNRNSRENIKTWKNRLTPREIIKIKEETFPVWVELYKEEDWD